MTDENTVTDVREHGTRVHHRNVFEGDGESPSAELIETIAKLEGVDRDELDPLYSWADGLVSDLYSSPPPADARAVVEFTYEGYRITLYQDGHAVFAARSEP